MVVIHHGVEELDGISSCIKVKAIERKMGRKE